jgi:transcriptional regulator with XRE-family HTH domain
MKRRKEIEGLPPLCAAIKTVRESYEDSQPQFASRVKLAPMTISRFERGIRVPADSRVLMRLAGAAREQGLTQEAELFESAGMLAAGSVEELREARPGSGLGLAAMPIFSLPQWRLMHAAGIAALYYPETASAIEQAAGPALALVDDAIRQLADEPTSAGLGFHDQLVRLLMTLAEHRALEQFKQEKK